MSFFIADHYRSVPHDKPTEPDQHQNVTRQMTDQQLDLLRNQIESFAIEHNYNTNVLERVHQIRFAVSLIAFDKRKRLQNDLINNRCAQSHANPHDIGLTHEDTGETTKRRQVMLVFHVEEHQRQYRGQRNDVCVVDMGKEVQRRKK